MSRLDTLFDEMTGVCRSIEINLNKLPEGDKRRESNEGLLDTLKRARMALVDASGTLEAIRNIAGDIKGNKDLVEKIKKLTE